MPLQAFIKGDETMIQVSEFDFVLRLIEGRKHEVVDHLFGDALGLEGYRQEWFDRDVFSFWCHLDGGNKKRLIEFAKSRSDFPFPIKTKYDTFAGIFSREIVYNEIVNGIECGPPYSSFLIDSKGWADAWGKGLDDNEPNAFADIVIVNRYEYEEMDDDKPEDREKAELRPTKLTDQAIDRGVCILLDKHPRIAADILRENGDALTGDALLQCVVFGEVIYG